MTPLSVPMNPPLRNLGLLLIAQLALAAALLWWQGRAPADAQPRALFDFDTQAVDRLSIEGTDKAHIELLRQGSGKDAVWIVAQAGNFPADAGRVRQAIDKLRGLQASGPIATSAEAIDRFKVGDTGFERRVQAQIKGKTVATLLLGATQRAGRTAARKAGDSQVWSVNWPTYDLGTKADDWIDKTVLRIPKEDIEAIEVDGLRLARSSSAQTAPATPTASAPQAAASAPRWTANALPARHSLRHDAAERLADVIANLSFHALRGDAPHARPQPESPALRIQVQRRGGATVAYTLYQPVGTEDRVLVVSNRPETFTLVSYQAQPLLDAARRDALIDSSAGK